MLPWKETGFFTFVSADEEEEHLRKIEELEETAAKKDAELTQLRSDFTQLKESAQTSQVSAGRLDGVVPPESGTILKQEVDFV